MADSSDLKWAVDAFRREGRFDAYTTYADYLAGSQDLALSTPKYAATFGTLFAAFSYNRCATVVDAHADRLQIERFNAEDESVTELSAELWRRNRMDARAGEIHKEAMTSGDAYLIVWPESGQELGEGGALPQFWPQRAAQMRVRYDDETPGQVVLATRTWLLSDRRRRLNLYYRDRIEKYVTTAAATMLTAATANALQPISIPGESWPVPNPWDVVPVFHFANNAGTGEYGSSELHDVLPLQDALNKVVGDVILASEMTAFTLKVLLGFDANDPSVMDAAARIETGRSKIMVVPPTVGGEQPKIDEFSAENLAQLVTVVELFDKLISRVSRVPIHYLQMSGDFPSGRALRTAEAPFVSKIEDRQTTYGNVWEDAMSLALRQAGVADPGQLETVWKSAAPLSEEDEWDLALQKSAVGVPLEQILREAGYSDEDITTIMDEKNAAADAFAANLTGLGAPANADTAA